LFWNDSPSSSFGMVFFTRVVGDCVVRMRCNRSITTIGDDDALPIRGWSDTPNGGSCEYCESKSLLDVVVRDLILLVALSFGFCVVGDGSVITVGQALAHDDK